MEFGGGAAPETSWGLPMGLRGVGFGHWRRASRLEGRVDDAEFGRGTERARSERADRRVLLMCAYNPARNCARATRMTLLRTSLLLACLASSSSKAHALKLDVFRVGRPLMPLDTLSSYSFDAGTFERFATADAPVIVGLEHGSANGVGVLAVVDASRASAAGAVVRAPVTAFARYRRDGSGWGESDVRPWRDLDCDPDSEACDVDLYGEAEAHDAWLSRELSSRSSRRRAPSRALAALYDDAASKVRRFSAYNGPRGDLEAAFLRVDGLAAFAASRRECYSFALTRQRELAPREVLAQLHSRSTAARLAASVEAAESTAGDVVTSR